MRLASNRCQLQHRQVHTRLCSRYAPLQPRTFTGVGFCLCHQDFIASLPTTILLHLLDSFGFTRPIIFPSNRLRIRVLDSGLWIYLSCLESNPGLNPSSAQSHARTSARTLLDSGIERFFSLHVADAVSSRFSAKLIEKSCFS